jgi:hypothetical protein
MEENKRHIDDFLRDELGSYTETPPPAVWEDLEQKLDAPTGRKGFDFRKWWWFIPALLFVAGGTFLAAHKWNQQPPAPAAPTIIDTASDNTGNGIAPDNIYKDTATENRTIEKNRPATKPVDTPAHTNTAITKPEDRQNLPTATGNNQTNTTIAGNGGKTVAQQDARSTTTASNNTNRNKHKQAEQTTQNRNRHHAEQNTTGNTVADGSNDHTHKQDVTAGQQRPKTKRATQQSAQAVAPNNNTSAATTEATVHNDQPVKHSRTARPAGNNTTAAGNENNAQSSNATAGNSNRQKSTGSKKQQAAAHAPATTSAGINDDATNKTETKKAITAKAVASKPQKQQATNNTANGPKENTAVNGAKDGAAKNIAARPARAPKARTTVAPKEQAPKINRAPKVSENVPATAKARRQKKEKEAPVAAAPANKRSRTNEVPMQSSSPVKESAKNQEYNFRSKTATRETPKAKDNLDLSDMQAKAETDTAEEKEMDPYASLNPPDDKKTKLHLEGGIKAAYTYGFNNYALNKITVLPYLQLNINTKLSVALHLGFSYGQMSKTALDGTQFYYNITDTTFSKTSFIDSLQGQLDTFYNYRYTQTRDSFSARHTIARSVWEIEIPVVFKYNFSSSLSIFAGPVFTFGKVVQINEEKSATYSRTIKDSVLNTQTQYTIEHFNNLYQPSGSPAASYSNAAYQNATSTPLRIGYTAGVSYNTGTRTTIDLSVQQMLSSPNFIPNETIRKTYTQPYVRLAVGFKLFK